MASFSSLMVTIPEVDFLGKGDSIVHALMKDACICILRLGFYD